jgi:hypothetical protein
MAAQYRFTKARLEGACAVEGFERQIRVVEAIFPSISKARFESGVFGQADAEVRCIV